MHGNRRATPSRQAETATPFTRTEETSCGANTRYALPVSPAAWTWSPLTTTVAGVPETLT